MHFQPYPFEKLNDLLQDITPNPAYKPAILTIGEPQFETPSFIQDALCKNSNLLRKYPKTAGEDELRVALLSFVEKRFETKLSNEQIVPSFGTREVLFNLPQFLLFDKKNPTMAYTNPFYQIYEGAAIASRAKVIHINLTAQNNFKPHSSAEELESCDVVILNFPNNPTASTLTVQELGEWVYLALKHNFVLINDECYSEIYSSTPPPSLLQASTLVGNTSFKNILVVNSISKRSSAPGLRSGFVAGDANILKEYSAYRTYIGCASPLPLQSAAAAAWLDEEHVQKARKIYANNLKLAEDILGIKTKDATFYVWLEVGDALEFTKRLYQDYAVKVLPGEFLARESGGINPAKGFVRIALVEDEEKTKDALLRIKKALA